MPTDILDHARTYLVNSLQGKHIGFETKHPWRKDWEFVVLHSLRVETYTLRILARENHLLSEPEIILLRLAAILHDIDRVENRENHGLSGAEIARKWFQDNTAYPIESSAVEKVLAMIADHSNKGVHEVDFSKAVLKDADTLDEIGVMSIFMASNWVETHTPFFFYNLRQRLIDFEIPFCDQKLTILNTEGAKGILREKKSFVENFIAQIIDEIQVDSAIEQMLLGFSKNQKPKCIIVTGRPGSGKTTLARQLGECLSMPVISRDEIKEGYVNTCGVKHDQLPADTNGLVTDLFFGIVYQYLAGNISIVIEAAFQHQVWEPRMPKILELASAWMVICAAEGGVAARRHLQRGLEHPSREFYHGDERVAHYRQTGDILPPDGYTAPEFDVPTLQVSTDGEYVPGLDEIVKQIRSSAA